LEINWTVARQLAIELQGNVLFARYAQAPRLKIFNFGNANVGAEYNILEIFDDFQVAEPFEQDDVKQPVIYNRVLEKWERSSITAPVPDKHK
jgi:hypothetical protein